MDSDNKPRLAVATGGTGGHFYPALSVAMEYRRRGGEARFLIGGQHSSHHLEIATLHGFTAVVIPAVRTPASLLEIPLFLPKLAWAAAHSLVLLRRHRIDRVLGMGSFATVPVGLAAAITGKPLYLHEGNAIIGRANRLLQRRARLLMHSLPLKYPESSRCPALLTGFPLRSQLIAAVPGKPEQEISEKIRQDFGLDPKLTTILVFGGSQGAAFINRLVGQVCRLIAAADRQTRQPFQMVHLTGNREAVAEVRQEYSKAAVPAYVTAWSDRMEDAYRAADLVLCRGGAATIAELAIFAKTAIIIPLPTAMEDHQTANAEELVKQKAALLVKTEEATPERIIKEIDNLITDPRIRTARSSQMAKLARPEAAQQIVTAILQEQH